MKKHHAFLLLFLLPGSPLLAGESHLMSFTLQDQFGRKYSDKDYEKKILVVLESDKGGSKYNPLWAKAIYDALEDERELDRIRLLWVANLKGVPFFLKKFIKGKFPKEKEHWVLMDWKGAFAKAYESKKKVCNILVFDDKGKLVYQDHGAEPDSGKLETIIAKLKSMLAQ